MAEAGTFHARARAAKKILVIGSGALGDAIHSLPALRAIRDAWPAAELHVLAAAPALYQALAPWVTRAWPPIQRRFTDNLALIRRVRAERFDAVIVIHAHNTMVAIAALSGAPARLTRRADFNKPWWWQRWVMTDVVDEPFHALPMYRQLWNVMKRAGLPGEAPRFDATVKDEWLLEAGLARADFGSYVHVSPFTTHASKELPAAQRAELVDALMARYPRVVLTCSGSPREKALMDELLRALPRAPWRVLAGALSLPQFVALVGHAKLHLGGDSGGMHAARLRDTPAVVWVRDTYHVPNWVPTAEPRARVLLSKDPRDDALHGIDTAAILAAAAELTP